MHGGQVEAFKFITGAEKIQIEVGSAYLLGFPTTPDAEVFC